MDSPTSSSRRFDDAPPDVGSPRALTVFAGICIAYAIAAQMAWSLFGAPELGMSFFPAAGITLGALVVLPRNRWPAVVLAVLVAETAVDLWNGVEVPYALGYAAANATEPLVGAMTIAAITRASTSPLVDIRRRSGFAAFGVGGLVVGPLIGALLGASVKTAEVGSSWTSNVVGWWVGDGLGVLSVGATLIVLAHWGERDRLRTRGGAVVVVLGGASTVAAILVPQVTTYLVVPILLVVAIRVGIGGVAVVGLVTAMVANISTALGRGPFSHLAISGQEQVVDTQLLIGASLFAAYLLAIEVSEREQAERLRQVEHEARIRAEGMEALGALSRQLALARRVGDVLPAVTRHVSERVGPSALTIELLDTATGRFRSLSSDGVAPAATDAARSLTLESPSPGPLAARTATPIFVSSRSEIAERFPALRPRADEAGTQALAAIPLSGPTGSTGYLLITWDSARAFDDDVRSYLRSVGDVVGQTIERARLMERDHDLAIELQHTMLGTPDDIEDVTIVTAYRPADSDVEIGGDWYDAIRITDHKTAYVVGDVVGHSLAAAKAMGQIRSAIRTLAPLFPDPGELMDRLEPFVESVANATPTTLLVAVHDRAANSLRYSSAGHLPPLLVTADGTPEFLAQGRGAPLGASLQGTRRVGDAPFAPGDTLILYTDGLVERRGEPLDVGLERLSLAARDAASEDADALCAALLTIAERMDDDLAILVVRPFQPAFRRTIGAEPRELATLRADLRAWLAEQGVDRRDIDDVLVSAGEAVSNAVEHAYLGRLLGEVRVEADLTGEDDGRTARLDLHVRDEGRWRRPPAHGDRGRGELLMRALSDDVRIRTGTSGTSVRIRHEVALMDGITPVPTVNGVAVIGGSATPGPR